MNNVLYFYLTISLCFTIFESIDRVARYWGFLKTSKKAAASYWLVKSFIRDLITNPFMIPELIIKYIVNLFYK